MKLQNLGRQPIERRFSRGIGVLGVAAAFVNGVLLWRVTSGPGDSNPIALLFVVGILMSPIPSIGLLGRLTGVSWIIWLAVSVGTLMIFLLFVLLMFGGAF